MMALQRLAVLELAALGPVAFDDLEIGHSAPNMLFRCSSSLSAGYKTKL